MKNPCNRSDSSKLCFSNKPCPKPGGSGSPTLVLLSRPHCNPSADGFQAAKVPARESVCVCACGVRVRDRGWEREREREVSHWSLSLVLLFWKQQDNDTATQKKRHVQLAGVKEQVKQMAASGSHNTPLLSSPPCR